MKFETLANNTYPGRGIILGTTPDGKQSVAAYFIMGRSVNSRNRIFSATTDGIRTEAFDPSRMEDPSLIIYHPVRRLNGTMIVTNGDQTDTVCDFLMRGESFENALRTRTFEPDDPNWTPRISGLLFDNGSYRLSILKSADGQGSACARQFFDYPALPGEGRFIHTYAHDGNPIPSFTGEPEPFAMANDLNEFTDALWQSLNHDNRVSLYVCYTDLTTGARTERIVNQNV
jgi:IMP cyclohydrolase